MQFGTTINGSGGSIFRAQIEFQNMLRRLDGRRWFAFALYPLPDDFDIYVSNPWESADEYLQSAGSSRRMVLELRRKEGDEFRHYALSRRAAEPSTTQVVIRWSDHEVTAFADEVFDAEEAIGVYRHYSENAASLPIGHRLRLLDLRR